ncbi:aldo/keto reductase [Sanguibacter sp. 25GB23B1]|uniref:aldo/keto reductase n=1 Tax=unclassified Sanguibacter TaxID=2645534 RepID=UPI0032AF95A3
MNDSTTLGRTDLVVGPLTLGTSRLGQGDDSAAKRDVLALALGGAVRAIDSGNNYGESEARVGAALRAARGTGAPSTGTLVITKADPAHGSTDFSGERMRASVRESQERLGLDQLPLVHLHDPERITFEEAMAPDGPVRALLDLRDAGVVRFVGVAGGPAAMMERYVRTGLFDAAVTHNRWTLLDRSARGILEACAEHQVGLFNAAPFGGGLLATRPGPGGSYAYRPASPAVLQAATAMHDACERHGVPLAAAALQLGARDERIASTIVGASSPEHLARAVEHASVHVPQDLWDELDALRPPEHEWLGPDGR